MSATVVLGAQFGDEGKGKLVDILAHSCSLCCRAQGGNNAGHTIVANGVTYDFHILPSGLINPDCVNVVGSGCVVHVPSLFAELDELQRRGLSADGRLFVSDRAHVVFDVHQLVDGLEEVELGGSLIGACAIGRRGAFANSLCPGTTKKGIGELDQRRVSSSRHAADE